jgi:flagellar motor switch/type III secretory pathway protein FliN
MIFNQNNTEESGYISDIEKDITQNEKTTEWTRLGHMNVSCSILVDKIVLPLTEFMELKPGFVLPLKVSVGDELDFIVNNQLFARGILIEENDQVAFKILSLTAV